MDGIKVQLRPSTLEKTLISSNSTITYHVSKHPAILITFCMQHLFWLTQVSSLHWKSPPVGLPIKSQVWAARLNSHSTASKHSLFLTTLQRDLSQFSITGGGTIVLDCRTKAHQEGLRIIPDSRVSRPEIKPYSSLHAFPPCHFLSPFISFSSCSSQCYVSLFCWVQTSGGWAGDGSWTREAKQGRGTGSLFLTLWRSDRKNKFCYAARIYFQFSSPSTLSLIFSQVSGLMHLGV